MRPVNQTCISDLTAGEGSAGNVVAGAGLRWWLNRKASMNSEFPNRYADLPLFVGPYAQLDPGALRLGIISGGPSPR